MDSVCVDHHDGPLRAAAAGDRHAREIVLVEYLPLVRGVASRYRGAGLPFDDLVQEGSVGLLEAIDHYDARLGVEFATYARFRVHRAIRNALTDRGRLVRLPKHVVERRRLLERERARAFAATGHIPTISELAVRTGLSEEAVETALDAGIDAVSLDEPVTADGSPLQDLVADPAASDPEATAVAHDAARQVDEAVERLPERQRLVVEHTFGFGTQAESIAQVASELHLSPQRTRTIVADALHKLRTELELLGTLLSSGIFRF